MSQKKIGVLLSYMSEAVKIITGFIYTPVMLRLLGQNEYGLYQLVYSVVSYLSLLSLGFDSSYIRYFSKYSISNDRDGIRRLNGMFMIIFSSLSVICLACGSVMVLNAQSIFGNGITGAELSKAKILLAILVVNMALTLINSVFNCYVTAHERFIFQKLLRFLQNLLNPFISLPLLLLGYGSVSLVVVTTVLTFMVFISNIFYCRKKLDIRFKFTGLKFSMLKELWIFTFFIFLNQIIDQINWSVDKFLLGRFKGTVSVAIYSVGAQINTMYVQASTAISNVFVPSVNKIVAKDDNNNELTDLMIKVGRIQFLILSFIVTGFVFFGQPFIKLWAGAEYADSYYVVLLLIIPVTIPLIQNIGIEIQRAKNMHKTRSVVYFLIAVSNILISIPLIMKFDSIGAAIGTMISLTAGNIIFMNFYYHKRIGLNMFKFWKSFLNFIPSLVLVSIYALIFTHFVNIKTWLSFTVSVIIFIIVYSVLLYLFTFNSYEKNILHGMLNKIKGRKKK